MRKEQCKTCKFFGGLQFDERGQCYYDPPQVVTFYKFDRGEGSSIAVSRRPLVKEDDFCSVYTNKEGE